MYTSSVNTIWLTFKGAEFQDKDQSRNLIRTSQHLVMGTWKSELSFQ